MPYNIIIADLATIGLQYWNYIVNKLDTLRQ